MTRDFTATTFVVLDGRTLLLFHRKIGAWFPPGGHIDPNELPDDAARREVREETGLDVELLSSRMALGEVEVLGRPECVLLEQINPDHQHIDLIYYARVVGGALTVSDRESEDYRWCDHADLGDEAIHEDIRILGREAIARVDGGRETPPMRLTSQG
jgi:ADP-ribose pyrophosphatase YjhB (NUDIX family)